MSIAGPTGWFKTSTSGTASSKTEEVPVPGKRDSVVPTDKGNGFRTMCSHDSPLATARGRSAAEAGTGRPR